MSEEHAGYYEFTLPTKMASAAAHGLYQQLMEQRGSQVVLNASKVEQLGVLCMQILVAAAKSWSRSDAEFEVIEPSQAFKDSAANIGLDLSLMGIEHAEEAAHGA